MVKMNSSESINPLDEADQLDKVQVNAYNVLKNHKPYAVIYAYSQGKGKVFLNPIVEKKSQEEVQNFVNSFKKSNKEGIKITVYVFYLTQLSVIEDALKGRKLI